MWESEKRGRVKRSTMAAYMNIIRLHVLSEFETMEDLASGNLQVFVDRRLEEGMTVKSLKDILIVVKMLVRFGREKGLTSREVGRIHFPKVASPTVEVFTPLQQRVLMDYLKGQLTFKNLGLLICINTGLRIGEVCGLKWEDIDLKRGTLSVNKTLYRIYLGEEGTKRTELLLESPKTQHSFRIVPLSESLKGLLKGVMDKADPGNFVLSNSSRPIEPRTYRNHYRRVIETLGLPELKFHCLRHSFATRCIESDCDYKSVSVILGHSNISTTLNLYVHPSYEKKKECIERMLGRIEGF